MHLMNSVISSVKSALQGKFQGLDLNEELHVGGYPNHTVLTKTAGIKTGFVGKTSLRREMKSGEIFSLFGDSYLLVIDAMQVVSAN